MASTDNSFVKAEGRVEQWYDWVFSLNHGRNPFHPTDGGKYWDVNNNNKDIIWLAGVTATTRPAYDPNNTPNLDAIVNGSEARVAYDNGNGRPVKNLPAINKRTIRLNKGDTRDLYIPPSTELATAIKYPKLADRLSELAQKIVDREDPPAFVEFQPANANIQALDVKQLKTEFRVNGSIGSLSVPEDNVFMLPEGSGAAAFSEYAVIVTGDSLKPGTNKLKFGVKGKHPAGFSYEVEYEIIK
jgi:hypothetical protein